MKMNTEVKLKIVIAFLCAFTVAVVIVEEIKEPYYSIMFFSKQAVPQAPSEGCKRLVKYQPFWSDREIYALDVSQEGDWMIYYHVGDAMNQNYLHGLMLQCCRLTNGYIAGASADASSLNLDCTVGITTATGLGSSQIFAARLFIRTTF